MVLQLDVASHVSEMVGHDHDRYLLLLLVIVVIVAITVYFQQKQFYIHEL